MIGDSKLSVDDMSDISKSGEIARGPGDYGNY